MRLYADTYLRLMQEHEPERLNELRKSGALDSRLSEIEEQFKTREMEIVMDLRAKEPLPKGLRERIGRVGNDASLAREMAVSELADLFNPNEPRENRRGRFLRVDPHLMS